MSEGAAGAERVYRVGELNRTVKLALEEDFASVWVEGEVMDVARPASGHVYFSLRDASPPAELRVTMWRSDAQRCRARLVPGAKVRVRGSLTIYEARGTYQLVAKIALDAGEGDRAAELERLRKKLAAEGLFDPARKRPLPRVPRVVGVVTSRDGAALRDVIKVASRRLGVRLVLAPTSVQGAEAPAGIVRALAEIAAHPGVEVVIVARGGGASEDLAAFQDERVARAIAACPIPVVTGVGHEIDVTLADLAADVRAATPSNAAELVVPDADALRAELEALAQRVERALDDTLADKAHALAERTRRLGDPRRRLAASRAAVQAIERDAERLVARRLATARASLEASRSLLAAAGPRARLIAQRGALEALGPRLERALAHRVEADRTALSRVTGAIEREGARLVPPRRDALVGLAARLSALSPLAVLGRGYAIALDPASGRALVRASDARVGAPLVVRLAEGALETEVRAVREEPA